MRGSTFETPYDVRWRVKAPEGARITVVLRSEKGSTDRRTVVLTERKTEADGNRQN